MLSQQKIQRTSDYDMIFGDYQIEDLKCPICLSVMRMPIKDRCMHSFCYKCFFKTKLKRCPLSRIKYCDLGPFMMCENGSMFFNGSYWNGEEIYDFVHLCGVGEETLKIGQEFKKDKSGFLLFSYDFERDLQIQFQKMKKSQINKSPGGEPQLRKDKSDFYKAKSCFSEIFKRSKVGNLNYQKKEFDENYLYEGQVCQKTNECTGFGILKHKKNNQIRFVGYFLKNKKSLFGITFDNNKQVRINFDIFIWILDDK